MPQEWYASDEAQQVGDIVIAVQKTNGGWMKNDQLHKLSSAEYQRLLSERDAHSCLDNFATTQEIRYLAKVYQATGLAKYRTAALAGVEMILEAQKGCGGWSQYRPLSGNYSYQAGIPYNGRKETELRKRLSLLLFFASSALFVPEPRTVVLV